MRIKHFAGYGCVNARKVKKSTQNGVTTLVVEVTGNHEWGILRNDMYDLKRWLVERFDKSVKDVPYWRIDYFAESDWLKSDAGYTERVIYTFSYPEV